MPPYNIFATRTGISSATASQPLRSVEYTIDTSSWTYGINFQYRTQGSCADQVRQINRIVVFGGINRGLNIVYDKTYRLIVASGASYDEQV